MLAATQQHGRWLFLPPQRRTPVAGAPGRKKPLRIPASAKRRSENAIVRRINRGKRQGQERPALMTFTERPRVWGTGPHGWFHTETADVGASDSSRKTPLAREGAAQTGSAETA